LEDDVQHIITSDINGNLLEGSRNYKLCLPGNIPASNFWSVIVYDSQTKLIICTDQLWPSVHSNCKNLTVNQDGSVDIFFGPNAPENKQCNWLQTLPGRGWYMILHLYEPLENWYNGMWTCGEVEEVKEM
jgi:hypothetical protein